MTDTVDEIDFATYLTADKEPEVHVAEVSYHANTSFVSPPAPTGDDLKLVESFHQLVENDLLDRMRSGTILDKTAKDWNLPANVQCFLGAAIPEATRTLALASRVVHPVLGHVPELPRSYTQHDLKAAMEKHMAGTRPYSHTVDKVWVEGDVVKAQIRPR